MLFLNVTIRTELGRKSKKLKSENKIPGILYGRKIESIPVSVDYKEFESAYKEVGESALISLNFKEGKTPLPAENVVLIRDAVRQPITRKFMHVDFYQVPMDEEITIRIPLLFENESATVKNEGGVLVRNIYELEVRALPKDLPREISVDLSRLTHINDAIQVRDLSVPQGVVIEGADDAVVAYVASPVEEEIAEEAVEAAATEEIKTEAEGKKEKREEEAKEEAALKEAGS